MKKIITTGMCLLVIMMLAAQVAPAQTVGFKVGMSSSNIHSSDEASNDEQDRLSSLAVGGFLRFGLGGAALQVEALGLTKGMKAAEGDDELRFKLDYIEIPVTAVFTFGNGPYVFGGGALALKTGCEIEVESGSVEGSVDCDDDPDFDIKSTDFGVLVGAGFQVAAGPGSVLFEARHTWGLANILDTDTDDSLKNRSLTFLAGYAVPLGVR